MKAGGPIRTTSEIRLAVLALGVRNLTKERDKLKRENKKLRMALELITTVPKKKAVEAIEIAKKALS